MHELELFIEKIEDFENLSTTSKVDFFVYYCLFEKKLETVLARDINICFEVLHLQKYSNISVYLSRNSISKKNLKSKYIKKKKGYILERSLKLEIEKQIGTIKKVKIEGSLFPLDLINNTRGYIENIGFQANACYECGLYDASLVMVRKLLETLIIELFEKFEIQKEIKDNSGNFFYLSELIPKLLNNENWTIGRNTKSSLPKIKKKGDLSAHNRRYNAKISDLDSIKDDLRIVVEELVHLNNFTK